MRKKRLITLLLLLALALTLAPVPASALEEPDLLCTNALLWNITYNEVLLDKGAHDKAYPASTTKILTALLVLEAIADGTLTLDQPVTADSRLSTDLYGIFSDSNPAIEVGEVLTVEELMYCLLVPSANEAANILACAVDGSVEAFVDHMNRRAAELGCEGTHFTNAHGMHDPDHYTTAWDLALMFKEAMKYDLFRTIVMTPKYEVPATNMNEARTQFNTNGLVSNWNYGGYVWDKCIGGKTGTTDEAGRCLVAAAQDKDITLISVILGSGPIDTDGSGELKQGQFVESRRLLEWGFSNFERRTLARGIEPVASVKVTMSREADEVLVRPEGSISRTLPKDLEEDAIITDIHLFNTTVQAPVSEGQVLGTMTLSYDGDVLGSLDLVATSSVARSELLYRKSQFLSFMSKWGTLMLILLVAVLIFYVVHRVRRAAAYWNRHRKPKNRNGGQGRIY